MHLVYIEYSIWYLRMYQMEPRIIILEHRSGAVDSEGKVMAERAVDSRASLWIALGNQPGVSAWFAVWLLARLSPPPRKAAKPVTTRAPAQPVRRVRAGTSGSHQEQPRP